MQRLNIIHGNRSERFPVLMKELETQGIDNYKIWDGVYIPHSVKASINAAHKQIVKYAQIAEWDSVIIAEDDLKFSRQGAWKYFLSQEPKEYDMYLGGIFLGQPDENNMVSEFTGLTLYSISKSFYETFLSVPDDDHLDRLLGGLGRYFVCSPFVCTQHNGVSGNTGRFEEYEFLQRNRIFY